MLDANKFMDSLDSDPNIQAIRHERGHELYLDLLRARKRAGLTQEQVAERMETTKSVISRIEAPWMKTKPTLRTIERFAQATGHRMKIVLEPIEVPVNGSMKFQGSTAKSASSQTTKGVGKRIPPTPITP